MPDDAPCHGRIKLREDEDGKTEDQHGSSAADEAFDPIQRRRCKYRCGFGVGLMRNEADTEVSEQVVGI